MEISKYFKWRLKIFHDDWLCLEDGAALTDELQNLFFFKAKWCIKGLWLLSSFWDQKILDEDAVEAVVRVLLNMWHTYA